MTHYLADHSHFTSKEEMDKAVKLHIQANWDAMNTTDRNVLDVIHRYSAKYGAAHLKHSTIEQLVGRSNSAVRRSPIHPKVRTTWDYRSHSLYSPGDEWAWGEYLCD